MAAKVKGTAAAKREIVSQGSSIKSGLRAGLWAAGLIVEGEAKKRVPVEYGKLRASGYTNRVPGIDKEKIFVGFSAHYAFYVHENLEAKWKGKKRKSGIGVYWGPKGQPRYLYNALMSKRGEARRLVSRYVKARKAKAR
jgi:hypothetical protein